MKKRSLFPLVATVFVLKAYAVELQNPVVSFEAVGKPSFLKIKGEGKALKHEQKSVNENGVNLLKDTFIFDLNTLNSGIDLRDEHMKEKYLKTKENPTATLVLSAADKSTLDFQGEKEVKGNLTLNGKTKEVTVKANREKNNIEAALEVKLTDFAIEIPSWSGITVADLVKIKTTFDLPLEAPALTR